MLLRSITKHIKEQNWFAVTLDFVIVVVGILLAFQITSWSDAQQEKAAFARAEIFLTEDLIGNYHNAKRQVAVKQCRLNVLRDVGKRLMGDSDEWIAISDGLWDQDWSAFENIVALPSNLWKYRVWDAELARGNFYRMDAARRNQIDEIFAYVELLELFGIYSVTNESRLAILSQTTTLNRVERNRLFQLVAEFDNYGVTMGQISGNIVREIEALNLKLTVAQSEDLHGRVERFNSTWLEDHGDCLEPITTPFLDGFESSEKP
nr:hypothetical protein [uncultured Glaciecola sp.]